ncbi:putative membrane protein [Synechococcus sp. BIOS-E4-1]|uniref:hypothetical protein n=1 Tax=Synechococcus sp. BIOS-E4-1 TaxID=1400864 RepID=UPI001645ECF8|nr:hypothetical protein [Synechococcus sp. BIOS-E4-1]QNI52838.1 putative membrane protein [Synechococcus sp. BIOS-E4-1]
MSQTTPISQWRPWTVFTVLTTTLGLGVIAAWVWLNQSLSWLPNPDSQEGKDLLYDYNRISHGLVFALLGLAVLVLLRNGLRPEIEGSNADLSVKPKPWWKHLITFAREHPLVLMLWAGYTVAMVDGSSWLFPELVGWYDSVNDHNLLYNFSIRWDFIKETMLRNDYRFFPLAHQDLHILSWFTPYVTIWMLVSAAELFTILLLTTQTVRGVVGRAKPHHLLLMISLLLLFTPATGFAFFQLIYSERILTLCFAAFGFFYLRYQQTHSRQAWSFTLLFALVGLFFKDIGVLLFTTPAVFTLATGAAGLLDNYPALPKQSLNRKKLIYWLEAYGLECALTALLIVFALAYAYLSYLPSYYHDGGAYAADKGFDFSPDLRFWFLLAFISIRIALIGAQRCRPNLIDGLNTAALLYGFMLFYAVGYDGSSYMSLPVQLVTVMDLAFIWCAWLAPAISRYVPSAMGLSLAAVATSSGLIALEELQSKSFLHRVSDIKTKQDSWLQTINEIEKVIRDKRKNGEPVNLIYTKSWFRKKRYLDQFNVDRLIFLDPEDSTYSTVSGIRPGKNYKPNAGDFLISIDRGNLDFLGSELDRYEKIYQYSRRGNGQIYLYRGDLTASTSEQE